MQFYPLKFINDDHAWYNDYYFDSDHLVLFGKNGSCFLLYKYNNFEWQFQYIIFLIKSHVIKSDKNACMYF